MVYFGLKSALKRDMKAALKGALKACSRACSEATNPYASACNASRTVVHLPVLISVQGRPDSNDRIEATRVGPTIRARASRYVWVNATNRCDPHRPVHVVAAEARMRAARRLPASEQCVDSSRYTPGRIGRRTIASQRAPAEGAVGGRGGWRTRYAARS